MKEGKSWRRGERQEEGRAGQGERQEERRNGRREEWQEGSGGRRGEMEVERAQIRGDRMEEGRIGFTGGQQISVAAACVKAFASDRQIERGATVFITPEASRAHTPSPPRHPPPQPPLRNRWGRGVRWEGWG